MVENGENKGLKQGKWKTRPDKGDSGFALWLGNDATPVINKCHNKWLKKKEIMLAIGLCTKGIKAFWLFCSFGICCLWPWHWVWSRKWILQVERRDEKDKILTDRGISGHICSDQKGPGQLIFLFRFWDLGIFKYLKGTQLIFLFRVWDLEKFGNRQNQPCRKLKAASWAPGCLSKLDPALDLQLLKGWFNNDDNNNMHVNRT